jgi:hypothetical protein
MNKKDLDDAEKQIHDLLKTNGMKIGYDILFPMYNQLPDEVKLALMILHRHGMKIVFTIKPETEAQ